MANKHNTLYMPRQNWYFQALNRSTSQSDASLNHNQQSDLQNNHFCDSSRIPMPPILNDNCSMQLDVQNSTFIDHISQNYSHSEIISDATTESMTEDDSKQSIKNYIHQQFPAPNNAFIQSKTDQDYPLSNLVCSRSAFNVSTFNGNIVTTSNVARSMTHMCNGVPNCSYLQTFADILSQYKSVDITVLSCMNKDKVTRHIKEA
eukprot:293967_1